jgi:predicted YcjX-like family ATPase
VTPLSRLKTVADAALESVGAALEASPLSQRRHRIAVTGLQRAGKTVFITAFAHALMTAARAPMAAFPFFPWREHVRSVELLEIPGVPRFPFEERLAQLLADTPAWPAPTTGLSGLRVRIRHDDVGLLRAAVSSTVTTDLDLIDYPGEWLLDLPMLGQSFRDWSRQMEELAHSAGRRDLAQRWLDAVRGLDADAPENPAELARIAGLYRDYLVRCRQERGLCFVQPGRFAMEGETVDPAASFFPLSTVRAGLGANFGAGIGAPKRGTMGAALLARHAAYLKQVRRFHAEVFGRLGKQVLLVDLLSALQQGREPFADLGLAIRSISDAFEELKHPLLRLLPMAKVERLALVATKADHVTADQHANLVNLLRDMVGEPFLLATARQSGLLAVASVKATTDLKLKVNDLATPFLRGIPAGRAEVLDIQPGVIPGTIPAADQWDETGFNIRRFEPPRLGAGFADRPLPHVNLDKVLQFLLARTGP